MEWQRLRSILRGQVRAAKDFATEHFRRYNADKGTEVQETIESFSNEVGDRLHQLDQTVKDLLQFVSILTILSSRVNRTRSLPGCPSTRLTDQRALQEA
jgi:ABC-type transporter Mla subunit MlaD